MVQIFLVLRVEYNYESHNWCYIELGFVDTRK